MSDNNSTIIGQRVDMTDAPGGDFDLDQLFGNPEADPLASTTQPQPPQPPAQTQPQAPAPAQTPENEYFLRTPTGTVYKNAEEASRGIAEKDNLIERLRQAEIARTGVDPVTGKAVQPQAQPEVVNYAQNGEKLYDDLVEAAQRGDRKAYAQVYQKFFNDMASPLMPLLTDVSRSRAVEAVATDIPDFRTFRASNSYNEVLESEPLLREAINQAENNLGFSNNLPGLYRLAYFASQGRRVPELVKNAAVPTSAPQPQTRTTVPAATMTPPPPAAAPDLRTPEGRQAIIREAEAKGIADIKF